MLTGEDLPTTPAEPAAPARAEKPFLVYVTDPSGGGTGDDIEKIEKVLLHDERIAFGSRAFTCVKMTPDDAKLDPIVSKQGKEIPRFVLVSADYDKSIAFEKNRLSASTVWDGMKAASDKHYAKSLDASVKEMREVLVEVDKIWAEKKTLTEKLARLEEKGEKAADAEKKAVEAKIAALDERQKKADETMAKVWEMKRKGEKEKAA